MSKVKMLLKLGERQYMERLLDKGELYFRPRAEFAKMDDSNGIGDKFETALSYYAPKNVKISIVLPDGETFAFSPASRIQYGAHSNEIKGLIYCMTSVDCECNEPYLSKVIIPKEITNIGDGYDSIVVIYDVPTFIERLKAEVERSCLRDVFHDYVSYYPERDIVKQHINPFNKIEKYAYQQEYRFYIDSDLKQSLLISIGSIRDIAQIINLERGVKSYVIQSVLGLIVAISLLAP